jgi:hypothetical protein
MRLPETPQLSDIVLHRSVESQDLQLRKRNWTFSLKHSSTYSPFPSLHFYNFTFSHFHIFTFSHFHVFTFLLFTIRSFILCYHDSSLFSKIRELAEANTIASRLQLYFVNRRNIFVWGMEIILGNNLQTETTIFWILFIYALEITSLQKKKSDLGLIQWIVLIYLLEYVLAICLISECLFERTSNPDSMLGLFLKAGCHCNAMRKRSTATIWFNHKVYSLVFADSRRHSVAFIAGFHSTFNSPGIWSARGMTPSPTSFMAIFAPQACDITYGLICQSIPSFQ